MNNMSHNPHLDVFREILHDEYREWENGKPHKRFSEYAAILGMYPEEYGEFLKEFHDLPQHEQNGLIFKIAYMTEARDHIQSIMRGGNGRGKTTK